MIRAAAFLFVLLLIPAVAWANAGTALMIRGWLHLVVGNLLIAVLEAGLLHWIWKVGMKRGFAMMLVANLVSWCGGAFVMYFLASRASIPIEHALAAFCVAVIAAWALTLLLETPFVALAFRKPERSARRVILGSLLIQTVSYILLVLYYAQASHLSLVTDFTVVEAQDLPLADDVLVYYIDEESRRVCSLDGGSGGCGEEVAALDDAVAPWLGIFPENPEAEENQHWVLREEEGGTVLVPGLRDVQIPWIYKDFVGPDVEDDWTMWFIARHPPVYRPGVLASGPVPRLGDAWRSTHQAYADSWRSAGLWVGDHGFEEGLRVAFDTPVLGTSFRRAWQIPGELLVVELASGQICILDIENRRIARLAWGRSVVVIMPKD